MVILLILPDTTNARVLLKSQFQGFLPGIIFGHSLAPSKADVLNGRDGGI